MSLSIAEIRDQLPAVQNSTYLNTGTAGPIPVTVHENMRQYGDQELRYGRASIEGYSLFWREVEKTRGELASFLHVAPEELALTHHTTEGINIVLWGLPWRKGDEVVTTTIEHEGILLPLAQLHHRSGVTVRYADIGSGSAVQSLRAIEKAITTRTRLIALSHVSFSTGAILPLKEIVEIAHQLQIPVLVDGAQSVGSMPLNLRELDVDFYAFPGQKWLLGPEGTGGLYVRRDRIAELEPTFVGYSSMRRYDLSTPHFLPAPGAKRYEVGSLYRPGIVGLGSAVSWLKELGWPLIQERMHHLLRLAREELSQLPSVDILTPREQEAGLLNFFVQGVDSKSLVQSAAQEGFIIRFIPDNGCLRLSIGFFNTEEEIVRFVQWLRKS